MAGVELRSVSKRFGKNYAVRDVSLSVGKGEFLSLVGPSGCGKTTTLRLVAGFLSPDEGEVLLDGESMGGVGVRQRQVGIVFQNYALSPQPDRSKRGLGPGPENSEDVLRPTVEQPFRSGFDRRACLVSGTFWRPAAAVAPRPSPSRRRSCPGRTPSRPSTLFELPGRDKENPEESGITTIYDPRPGRGPVHLGPVALMNDGRIEQTGRPDIYLPGKLRRRFVGVNKRLEESISRREFR